MRNLLTLVFICIYSITSCENILSQQPKKTSSTKKTNTKSTKPVEKSSNVFSFQEITNAIDKDITIAAENSDFSLIRSLKVEKNIWSQISKAESENDTIELKILYEYIEDSKYIPIYKSKYLNLFNSIYTKENKIVDVDELKSVYKTVKFDLDTNKNDTSPFPRLYLVDNRFYNPIGLINSIEVGYTYVKIDRSSSNSSFFTLIGAGSDQKMQNQLKDELFGEHITREVKLIFTNKTSEKIYFDNKIIYGEVKFTGQTTYYNCGGQTCKVKGGLCQVSSESLDIEDGKYVMLPDKMYAYTFYITQDADNLAKSMLLRRFMPLQVCTKIPKALPNPTTELMIYPDLSNKNIEINSVGNYIEQKIQLPNKEIVITSAYRGITSKSNFPDINGYQQVFKSDNLEVLIKISNEYKLDDYGDKVFDINIKIKNLSDKPYDTKKIAEGVIGELKFQNAGKIKLHIGKYWRGSWEGIILSPGEIVEYSEKIKVSVYSGELFFDGKYKPRQLENNTKPVLVSLKIRKDLYRTSNMIYRKTLDGKTKINFYNKPIDIKFDDLFYSAKDYFYKANVSPVFVYPGNEINTVYEAYSDTYFVFEKNKINNYPFVVKRMKYKDEKDLQKWTPTFVTIPDGHECFLILRQLDAGYKLEFVTKEEFSYFVKNSIQEKVSKKIITLNS
jgi:hypothetical protein